MENTGLIYVQTYPENHKITTVLNVALKMMLLTVTNKRPAFIRSTKVV